MTRPRIHLIDLSLDEVSVPAKLSSVARTKDPGVLPEAMAEYIRKAGMVPVWPDVTYDGKTFRPTRREVYLWAARSAGFAGSVRCVYRQDPKRLPAAIAARLRTLKDVREDVESPEASPGWQMLSFARPPTRDERERVRSELEQLAELARARGVSRFSEIMEPEWVTESTFAWRTWTSANVEDRSMAMEMTALLQKLSNAGLPLLAWNGLVIGKHLGA
jgi:hypothetical protein